MTFNAATRTWTSKRLYGRLWRVLVTAAPRWLPLTLIVLAIGALTAGGIRLAVRQHYAEAAARLDAIADLKTRQIADWLRERQGDARQIQASSFLTETYRRGLESGDPASRDRLKQWFNQFRKNYAINSVLLLDERGEPLWGSAGDLPAIDPALRAAARQAIADQQTSQLGPYRDPAGRVWMDFLAPLPRLKGQTGPVVVLRDDPADYLYPTLKTWPVPSPSGEALLFRRDGEDIFHPNELRHPTDTALKLQVSIGEEKRLAAQVLHGEARPGGGVEGVDYRGVAVIGVIRPVPGTDWYLVAKLDRAEVYAGAAGTILGISLAGLLALVVVGTSAVLWRQREHLAAARREQALQAEQLHALQLLDAFANSTTDAIFAKDSAGRYRLFNRAAAVMANKPAEVVLGRDDTALFPPAQAERVMAEDRQLLADGRLVTLEEEFSLPNGAHTFLTTKGPLRDTDGTVIGLFGIVRDITERKRIEEELRSTKDRLEAMISALPDLMFRVDREGRIHEFHSSTSDQLYLSPALFLGKKLTEVLPEGASRIILTALEDAAKRGWHRGATYALPMPQGVAWYELSIAAMDTPTQPGDQFILLVRDITTRKRFEEELRITNRNLNQLATTDPLTDTWNRRYFVKAVEVEVARAKRYSQPLCLLLFDIDHFKSINDRYGHLAGDHVLVELTRRIRQHLRAGDMLARWGGEEFVVMMPYGEATVAVRLAEKLRVLVANQPFPEVGTVTVSFGVAEFHPHETLDAWFKRVDVALYQAKVQGRNRVVVAESVLAGRKVDSPVGEQTASDGSSGSERRF